MSWTSRVADAHLTAARKSFEFDGRASRSETWWCWFGAQVLIVGAWAAGDAVSLGAGPEASAAATAALALPVGASTVRRFHDRDRSGWWVLPIAVGILVASTTIIYTSNLDTSAFIDNAMRGRTSELAAVLILFTASWVAMIASVPSIIIMSGRGTAGPNRFGPPPEGQGENE